MKKYLFTFLIGIATLFIASFIIVLADINSAYSGFFIGGSAYFAGKFTYQYFSKNDNNPNIDS